MSTSCARSRQRAARRPPRRRLSGIIGRIAIVLIVGATSAISGAVPGTGARIEVTAVKVVDYRDESELAPPGLAALEELVGKTPAEVAGPKVAQSGSLERPHRLLVRVDFTDDGTLLKRTQIRDTTTFVHSYFCQRPDTYSVLSGPTVYFNGRALRSVEPIADIASKDHNRAGAYYFFLNVSRDDNLASKPPQHAFDLQKRPEDVCFFVTVGGIFGVSYQSAVGAVRKVLMENAFLVWEGASKSTPP